MAQHSQMPHHFTYFYVLYSLLYSHCPGTLPPQGFPLLVLSAFNTPLSDGCMAHSLTFQAFNQGGLCRPRYLKLQSPPPLALLVSLIQLCFFIGFINFPRAIFIYCVYFLFVSFTRVKTPLGWEFLYVLLTHIFLLSSIMLSILDAQ